MIALQSYFHTPGAWIISSPLILLLIDLTLMGAESRNMGNFEFVPATDNPSETAHNRMGPRHFYGVLSSSIFAAIDWLRGKPEGCQRVTITNKNNEQER